MMTHIKQIILLAVLSVALSVNGFSTGHSQIISNLPAHQSESGGFILGRDYEPTVETTQQAMYLASLFGLRSKVDLEAVERFIESVHNSDNGYSNVPGEVSDIESVRDVIQTFNYISKAVSNPSDIESFVNTHFDSSSNLYASRVGNAGDMRSTAAAFQVFEKLGLLESSTVVKKAEGIKKNLQSLIKTSTDKRIKYFSSITADNYYSIVVANYVGVDFGDVEPWALYFIEQQVRDGSMNGGFFSDKERTEVSVEDSYHSVAALEILQKASKSDINFVNSINLKALVNYFSQLQRGVQYTYFTYATVSRTQAFESTFRIGTLYDVHNPRFRIVGNRIIQGTQLTPTIGVKSIFGVPHPELDVTVVITHVPTDKKDTYKLTWNQDTQSYRAGEAYATSDKLGELKFDYTLQYQIESTSEPIVLRYSEAKSVGYDMTVSSKAVHAGKNVEVNGVVGFGTEFSFDVKLGNEKQPKPALVSGDFSVTFTVRDSSNAIIHEKVKDCRSNSGAIKFDYTLESSNIPEGELRFGFEVANNEGTHTAEYIVYNLPVTMVATEISFEGSEGTGVPTYKIGDNIKVKMTPASLPDLRTIQHYSTEDARKKPILRKFVMVVSSPDGAALFTLQGTSDVVNGHAQYTFDLPVRPIFDSIGTKQISFIYESASGQRTELRNFDSKTGELFEESTHLTYKVNADVHLTDIKNAPKPGKLEYGNEVKFSFKVKDEVSGQNIWIANDGARVYLALRHKEEGRVAPFTSAKHSAELSFDDKQQPAAFQITWTVNPNAIQGQAYLDLYAEGQDGKEIPVLKEGSKDTWTVSVDIGGEIDVDEHTFSSVVGEDDAVFFVEVELSCEKKRLNDAQLKATVSLKGSSGLEEILTDLPVTHASQPGHYQVSWRQDKSKAKSGEYVVQFYREVDRYRLSAEELKPFFSVSLGYQPDTGSPLPMKTEVLVALILGAAFFWSSFKKLDIENITKDSKKKKY